jgi:hypothetical protein
VADGEAPVFDAPVSSCRSPGTKCYGGAAAPGARRDVTNVQIGYVQRSRLLRFRISSCALKRSTTTL